MSAPPIDTPEQAETVLHLFNSKMDRICSYSFFRHRIKYAGSWTIGEPLQITVDCASDEQIDAVLLHLRFFMAINENSSWHNIKKAYGKLSPTAEIQTEFDKAFQAWMDWRNRPSKIGGANNAVVMGAMMYGERVHRNDSQWIQIYDEWMSNVILEDFSVVVFCDAIHQLVWTLEPIYIVNKKILNL